MSHVTWTPLSRSKCQSSTCRGGAYCGGLPHSLFGLDVGLVCSISVSSWARPVASSGFWSPGGTRTLANLFIFIYLFIYSVIAT